MENDYLDRESMYTIVADSYNTNTYNNQYRDNRSLTSTEKYLLKEVLRHTRPDSRNILSVGCGAANLYEPYLSSNKGVVITGIDISESQINKARRNIPNGNFWCNNFLKVNEDSIELFDGIICMYALFNFIECDQPTALQKMYNILRPGGKCLINVRKEIHDGIKYNANWCGQKMYWYLPGVERIVRWCKDIGFTVNVYDNPDNSDYIFLLLG